MAKFQIGDLCVTQYATAGLLNNGHVVEILDVDPRLSESAPTYLICRIDGQPIPQCSLPLLANRVTFSAKVAWSAEYKLRRANQGEAGAFLEQTTALLEPGETGVGA
ncbi:MAG: hypothetical protein IPK39_19730 [Sulfuritalea sp.]|nr:hypothetical protein [Sulfuritalea sp.]